MVFCLQGRSYRRTWTACAKFLNLIGRRLKRISDIKLLPIEVASCIVYLSANLFVQNSWIIWQPMKDSIYYFADVWCHVAFPVTLAFWPAQTRWDTHLNVKLERKRKNWWWLGVWLTQRNWKSYVIMKERHKHMLTGNSGWKTTKTASWLVNKLSIARRNI